MPSRSPRSQKTSRSAEARAAIGDTLTIAYNLPVPSWDPTTGTSAVNPALASIYKSVFDQYVDQAENLDQIPGVLTEWAFNADKSGIRLTLGEGRRWADGKPITADDIVWNLRRLGDPKTGNPGRSSGAASRTSRPAAM